MGEGRKCGGKGKKLNLNQKRQSTCLIQEWYFHPHEVLHPTGLIFSSPCEVLHPTGWYFHPLMKYSILQDDIPPPPPCEVLYPTGWYFPPLVKFSILQDWYFPPLVKFSILQDWYFHPFVKFYPTGMIFSSHCEVLHPTGW